MNDLSNESFWVDEVKKVKKVKWRAELFDEKQETKYLFSLNVVEHYWAIGSKVSTGVYDVIT